MSTIQFVQEHWGAISSIGVIIISEVMALNPNWKYNGILDLLKGAITNGKPSGIKPLEVKPEPPVGH